MLECWNDGILEYWNVGMLECWNVGILGHGIMGPGNIFDRRVINMYDHLQKHKPRLHETESVE